ncbi:MAG: Hint domain-containing protein [Bacteroidota bacterium]
MNYVINLIKGASLLLLLILVSTSSKAQTCFENLGEASGIDAAVIEAEMDSAACAFIQTYPVQHQNNIKIYDFGFYAHNEVFEDDIETQWSSITSQVSAMSTYYVIVGKITGQNGIYHKAKVAFHLPLDQSTDCLEEGSNYDLAETIMNFNLSPITYVDNYQALLYYFKSSGGCEDCTNGVDDDGDGFMDCEDIDCFAHLYSVKGDTKSSTRNSCNPACMDISEEDLKAQLDEKIEARLLELETEGFWDQLDKIYDFIHCDGEDDWAPKKPNGVIPECLWNNSDGTPGSAFLSGFIDGCSNEIKSLIDFIKEFESKSEMLINYTSGALLAYGYGCQEYWDIQKQCGTDFTEDDLKELIHKKMKELEIKGQDSWFGEWGELDLKEGLIPQLIIGCKFKKQIDDLIEVIDIYELAPIVGAKIQEYVSDLSSEDLDAWYEFGYNSVIVAEILVGYGIKKIADLSKFVTALKNSPSKFVSKFCDLGRGCFVEGTPVMVMGNEYWNTDYTNQFYDGQIAGPHMMSVPIQEVQLLDYVVAHKSINLDHGLLASTDDHLFYNMAQEDFLTSDQQRLRDKYELNDTDWNEVVFHEMNGNTIAKFALHIDWIIQNQYAVENIVKLQLPEQGVDGFFKVVSIKHILPQKKPELSPEDSEYDFRPVTALISHPSDDVYQIEFENGDVLGVTYLHPIYSLSINGWKLAGQLHIGEKVLTISGETQVASKFKKEGTETVYNLEIKDLHNFLVGESGIVVHNNYGLIQSVIDGIFNATSQFHSYGKCKEFANALRVFFKNNNVANPKMYVCRLYDANGSRANLQLWHNGQKVADNGLHVFTPANGKIYDNMQPNGMDAGEYMKQFEYPVHLEMRIDEVLPDEDIFTIF